MPERLTTIHINKEGHKFSAAHFTIFSATERERLHGHNFSVSAHIVSPVDDNGLADDYASYKRRLKALCDSLDEYTIIPTQSPYLQIEEQGDYYRVSHHQDVMLLLKSDTLLLPLHNTTVEELSHYLLYSLLQDQTLLAGDIRLIELAVSTAAGQSACSTWEQGAATELAGD